jgi:hypothetical protein
MMARKIYSPITLRVYGGAKLREGDLVTFDVGLGKNGGPAASKVRLANG